MFLELLPAGIVVMIVTITLHLHIEFSFSQLCWPLTYIMVWSLTLLYDLIEYVTVLYYIYNLTYDLNLWYDIWLCSTLWTLTMLYDMTLLHAPNFDLVICSDLWPCSMPWPWPQWRYVPPGSVLQAMSTGNITRVDFGVKGTQLKLSMVLDNKQKVVFKPKWSVWAFTRDSRFGSKVGQIGPKWDKSGAF